MRASLLLLTAQEAFRLLLSQLFFKLFSGPHSFAAMSLRRRQRGKRPASEAFGPQQEQGLNGADPPQLAVAAEAPEAAAQAAPSAMACVHCTIHCGKQSPHACSASRLSTGRPKRK